MMWASASWTTRPSMYGIRVPLWSACGRDVRARRGTTATWAGQPSTWPIFVATRSSASGRSSTRRSAVDTGWPGSPAHASTSVGWVMVAIASRVGRSDAAAPRSTNGSRSSGMSAVKGKGGRSAKIAAGARRRRGHPRRLAGLLDVAGRGFVLVGLRRRASPTRSAGSRARGGRTAPAPGPPRGARWRSPSTRRRRSCARCRASSSRASRSTASCGQR